jgi:hypothetical protein
MNEEKQWKYMFALECAAFELDVVRKVALVEGRLMIASNIEDRIAELDELRRMIRDNKVQEVTDEA